jgi:hypothetical protein
MAPKKASDKGKGKGKSGAGGDGERPKWISAELWALASNMPGLVAALGGGDAAKAPAGVSKAEVRRPRSPALASLTCAACQLLARLVQ